MSVFPILHSKVNVLCRLKMVLSVIKSNIFGDSKSRRASSSRDTAILLTGWILPIGGTSAVEGWRSTGLRRLECSTYSVKDILRQIHSSNHLIWMIFITKNLSFNRLLWELYIIHQIILSYTREIPCCIILQAKLAQTSEWPKHVQVGRRTPRQSACLTLSTPACPWPSWS